jgi:ubiquinone/menaquinone biosynthesis C-methylase UbiE
MRQYKNTRRRGQAGWDAVVCRMGLMLFLDPLQDVLEMRRVLKPDGGFCTMVFSVPDNNPCMATLMSNRASRAAGLLSFAANLKFQSCL